MRKIQFISGLFLVTSFMGSNAFAQVLDQYVSSGIYGQTWGGSAYINVSVDGSGVNRVARLAYGTWVNGYNYWYGEIPADAVKVTGVSSIAVQIDTCSLGNGSGCGYVDVTINTTEPASGWVYTGVYDYSYGDMIMHYVGNNQVRFSSASGTVLGIPVSETQAGIGMLNTTSITVSLGK